MNVFIMLYTSFIDKIPKEKNGVGNFKLPKLGSQIKLILIKVRNIFQSLYIYIYGNSEKEKAAAPVL